MAYAKRAGKLVSFDPNLRKPLWASEAEAKEQMEWGLGQSDIVKISDEEVDFLWGLSPEEGAQRLLKEYGVKLDIFGGSAMSRFLKLNKAPDSLTVDEMEAVTRFACCAASLSTQTHGGIFSVVPEERVLSIL